MRPGREFGWMLAEDELRDAVLLGFANEQVGGHFAQLFYMGPLAGGEECSQGLPGSSALVWAAYSPF